VNNGALSPDNLWQRASWIGTGGDTFIYADEVVQTNLDSLTSGFLVLTVKKNSITGGEVQTVGANGSNLGYGYYEVRMKTAYMPGMCVSFFWKQVNYGAGEIDIEFLTGDYTTIKNYGAVRLTVQGAAPNYKQMLTFNPSADFHRYGFLWTATKIIYTVDGHVVYTISSPQYPIPSTKGYIMMNAWTGTPGWGDGPPMKDSPSYYDWVKFWPNLASVPDDSAAGVQDEGQVKKAGQINQAVSIYPNPAVNVITVRSTQPQTAITVYDFTGKQVEQLTTENGRPFRLDQSDKLRNGAYLIKAGGNPELFRVMVVK
jgi:beta-glucanase (GH16 family)